jgi:hypothetical protein
MEVVGIACSGGNGDEYLGELQAYLARWSDEPPAANAFGALAAHVPVKESFAWALTLPKNSHPSEGGDPASFLSLGSIGSRARRRLVTSANIFWRAC